ncbi:MAG: glutathione S-transferase family protein [Pseudomonadota bacterium]
MIELFALPVSAYCAKVRIALEMKRVDYRELPPPDGYGSAAYRSIVPAGSIPAIRDGDFTLHDADAILDYLDECYPTPPLLPEGIELRAWVRSLARFHDSEYEPRVRAFFPLVGKPKDERVAAAIENLLEIHLRFESIAQKCGLPNPYLGGGEISKADLCYAPTVRMARRILMEFDTDLDLSDAISNWLERIVAEPGVAHSQSIMSAALDSWIDSKQNE